jgi:hypothetical protein
MSQWETITGQSDRVDWVNTLVAILLVWVVLL